MKTEEERRRERKRTCVKAELAAHRAILAGLKPDVRALRYRLQGESIFDYAFDLAVINSQFEAERKRKSEANYDDEHKRELALKEIDMALEFIRRFPDEHDGYEPPEAQAGNKSTIPKEVKSREPPLWHGVLDQVVSDYMSTHGQRPTTSIVIQCLRDMTNSAVPSGVDEVVRNGTTNKVEVYFQGRGKPITLKTISTRLSLIAKQ